MKAIKWFLALSCQLLTWVVAIDHLRKAPLTEKDGTVNGFTQPLITLDQQLFDELIADKEETQVRDSQVWFIMFDSPHCKRCGEVLDVWEDLANHNMNDPSFNVAYLFCPRAFEVCQRLQVRGYPTLSVLDGRSVYDYQG